jgi:hypothetical protein
MNNALWSPRGVRAGERNRATGYTDADPDPTFHPDAAPDQDTSFIIWLKPSYSINFGSNCGFLFDVDPGLQNDGDSCGSGSTTLAKTVHCTFLNSF